MRRTTACSQCGGAHSVTQTPYERFVSGLPAKVAARNGEPALAVLEGLVRDFRATCPRSSLNQFRDAVSAIKRAMQ